MHGLSNTKHFQVYSNAYTHTIYNICFVNLIRIIDLNLNLTLSRQIIRKFSSLNVCRKKFGRKCLH